MSRWTPLKKIEHLVAVTVTLIKTAVIPLWERLLRCAGVDACVWWNDLLDRNKGCWEGWPLQQRPV